MNTGNPTQNPRHKVPVRPAPDVPPPEAPLPFAETHPKEAKQLKQATERANLIASKLALGQRLEGEEEQFLQENPEHVAEAKKGIDEVLKKADDIMQGAPSNRGRSGAMDRTQVQRPKRQDKSPER